MLTSIDCFQTCSLTSSMFYTTSGIPNLRKMKGNQFKSQFHTIWLKQPKQNRTTPPFLWESMTRCISASLMHYINSGDCHQSRTSLNRLHRCTTSVFDLFTDLLHNTNCLHSVKASIPAVRDLKRSKEVERPADHSHFRIPLLYFQNQLHFLQDRCQST